MTDRDLTECGELAELFAELIRDRIAEDGSGWDAWPVGFSAGLSAAKARHDFAQYKHLCASSTYHGARDGIAEAYENALNIFKRLHPEERMSWSSPAARAVARAAARFHHVRRSPRLTQALSGHWSRTEAELAYARSGIGLIVIDEFLSSQALAELRRSCLNSTVWAGNRYPSGRLSSLLITGFSSPLLMQLAEEIRDAFPGIIGQNPLRQLWGFKSTERLPGLSTVHADCAAVNVNIWITPDGANRDPLCGGMVVYPLEAPEDWGFERYNRDVATIRQYLTERNAKAIRIPYRANRAIIFNSDLFHETEAVDFDPGYENHRVNITLLFGDRENSRRAPVAPQARRRPWRSRAFR